MDLRWLTDTDTDAVLAAGHLFDYDPRVEWVQGSSRNPATIWSGGRLDRAACSA